MQTEVCDLFSMLKNTSFMPTVLRMPLICTTWPTSGKKLIGWVAIHAVNYTIWVQKKSPLRLS